MSHLSFSSVALRRVGCSLIRSMSADFRLTSSLLHYSSSQHLKIEGKKICPLDTTTLIKRLEAQGLPTNQAEAIASTITELCNSNLDHVPSSSVSKSKLDEFKVVQNSILSEFKSELKIATDNHQASLQRKFDKLDETVEKMDITLASKIEKGNIEFISSLYMINSKLDKETLALRGQLNVTKFDIITYSAVGICFSFAAVVAAMHVWK